MPAATRRRPPPRRRPIRRPRAGRRELSKSRSMQEFLQNLLNGIAVGAIYALIALGYTMVYGILRLINFAHGDVFMLGSFVGCYAGGRAARHMDAQAGALGWRAAGGVMLLAMIVSGA